MGSHFNVSWFWTKQNYNDVCDIIKNFDHPIFHICSGVSCIGDIRVDRSYITSEGVIKRFGDFHLPCNIMGDMLNIPFRDGVAGSIICDPPYDYDFTNNNLINELTRIAKPKANILFIAPWIPKSPVIKLKSHDLWIVGKNKPYYKIASTFYKSNGQLGDYV